MVSLFAKGLGFRPRRPHAGGNGGREMDRLTRHRTRNRFRCLSFSAVLPAGTAGFGAQPGGRGLRPARRPEPSRHAIRLHPLSACGACVPAGNAAQHSLAAMISASGSGLAASRQSSGLRLARCLPMPRLAGRSPTRGLPRLAKALPCHIVLRGKSLPGMSGRPGRTCSRVPGARSGASARFPASQGE